MTSRIELPAALAEWIRTNIPMVGDPRQLKFRSCRRIPFWWIPGNRDMSGLTLGRRIYLREEYCPLDAANPRTVELIFHELIHVLQFRRNPLLFPLRYLVHHLHYGYANNPAEIEARQMAARLTHRYLHDHG